MVIEAGVVVGYLAAWVSRKARRAAKRLDTEADIMIDAGLDKLHELVAARLGATTLADLEREAADGDGQVSELTRRHIEFALMAAARNDEFARAVSDVLAQIRDSEQSAGQCVIGDGAVYVAGDVDIHAESGAAAAWSIGTVNLGRAPDPS